MKTGIKKQSREPFLIEGSLCVDDRGEVSFANEFDMQDVRRFYTVANHKQGFIRAWHAHKEESKYVTIVNGSALVAVVKIDNWEKPSKNLKIRKYILSSKKPSVLFIPAGFANGFMGLTEDVKLLFFSTSTLKESLGDDIRYDAYCWNAWKVIER